MKNSDLTKMLASMRELRDLTHGELVDKPIDGRRYVTVTAIDVLNCSFLFKKAVEKIFMDTANVDVGSVERKVLVDEDCGVGVPALSLTCSVFTGEYGLFYAHYQRMQKAVFESFDASNIQEIL